jgi:hypothetical protein
MIGDSKLRTGLVYYMYLFGMSLGALCTDETNSDPRLAIAIINVIVSKTAPVRSCILWRREQAGSVAFFQRSLMFVMGT